MSLSEKVTKLITVSVSVLEWLADLVGDLVMLFCIALDCLVASVADDWKVEMEPVDNRLSWIFVIVSAGVVAPDMSSSSLVLGKIRSVLYARMLVISWSAFITTMHSVSVSHQASHAHSIAPSVKNLWNLAVLIVPSHSPIRKTRSPAMTSHACWLQLGWK